MDRALRALGLDVWTDQYEIRLGDSLVSKIFDEGLRPSDYVCAFLTKNSVGSQWVREELEYAFIEAVRTGRPKILVLRFDRIEVPSFLRSRRYVSFERFELGGIVRTIMSAAHVEKSAVNLAAEPYATLDFHDALKVEGAIYLLASRADPLDMDPFFDPEGISFLRRDCFLLRVNEGTQGVLAHRLTRGRITHTAMRLLGEELLVFVNDKVENNSFSMVGRLFRIEAETLRPKSVRDVFTGVNWGWDPWIDEQGLVHHKDSETDGNPYRVEQTILPDHSWRELSRIQKDWRDLYCPYPLIEGPGRETGYLRFLDVDVRALMPQSTGRS